LDIDPSDAARLARDVACAAAGDRRAFERLVIRYQRPLFSFLARMGLRQFEAEEVAQEAFIRAWQHLDRYQAGQGAFSTWLYTIARRLALHEIDRAGRRLQGGSEDAPALAVCERPGPEQSLQLQQQQAALLQALRDLSVGDRSVLALAYTHELSLAEMARIEGCGETAVKARLHRARLRLRRALPALNPNLPE
jgi:RNA polymerase sigma-70 factor (ECF subfamily)